jgi:hypothetical protein
MAELVDAYADLGLGGVDASLIALAERLEPGEQDRARCAQTSRGSRSIPFVLQAVASQGFRAEVEDLLGRGEALGEVHAMHVPHVGPEPPVERVV